MATVMMMVAVLMKLAVIGTKNHDSSRRMMHQEKGLVSAMDGTILDPKMHAFDEEQACVLKDLLHLHSYTCMSMIPPPSSPILIRSPIIPFITFRYLMRDTKIAMHHLAKELAMVGCHKRILADKHPVQMYPHDPNIRQWLYV